MRRPGGEALPGPPAANPWPEPLRDAAFHGRAREIVRLIEPDPAALLFQFLAAFGNAAGSGAYVRVEADRLPPRLTCCRSAAPPRAARARVGAASASRSGSDDGWPKDRIASGLSSGGGLMHEVRDPTCTTLSTRRPR